MKQHRFALVVACLGIFFAVLSLVVVIILSPLEGTLLTLFFAGVCGTVYWTVFRPMLRDRFLRESGLPAEALILEARDTGTTVNRNPKVDLLLEVRPDKGESYQARVSPVVSRLQAPLLQPGTTVQVKYDPADRRKVALASLPAAGTGSADLAAKRLEQLEKLKRKGLLTESEYRRKREEILRGL